MEKPFVIGISGGSGSGKTALINALKAAFSRDEICFVSQDDYYRPRELQKVDENGVTNFDLPKAIDKKSFREDLERLIGGESVTRLEYTFNNKKVEAATLTFQPAPIIMVEGLFVFHYKKIKKLLDLKVFVHAKENLKLVRRIVRDQQERNYPLDDVLYRYQHHVLPSFEKYIKPYREDVDIVINNNSHFDVGKEVLMGFLRDRIGRQGETIE